MIVDCEPVLTLKMSHPAEQPYELAVYRLVDIFWEPIGLPEKFSGPERLRSWWREFVECERRRRRGCILISSEDNVSYQPSRRNLCKTPAVHKSHI